MSGPFEFDVRRSPRLLRNYVEIPASSLRRIEKLRPRRKLMLDDIEDTAGEVSNSKQKDKEKGRGKINEDELPPDVDDLEGYWSEDSVFSDIVVGETEIEGDLVDGDELFSNYIDESLINVVNKTLNQSCAQTKVSENGHLLNVDDVNVEIGSEDELVSDDDNRSVVGSDDELGSYDVFDPTVDFEKPINLKVGLLFPSVEMLRKAVRQHAIENGYEPYFLHNESKRVTIQCRHRCECAWNSKKSRMPKCTCGMKNPCAYKLYATKVNGEELTFEIISLNLEHICVYTTKNRMVTSEFIAEKYLETWRSDPGWSLIGTQSRVKLDYGVDVNYHKCWLARARAKLFIYGNSDEQYTRVWDYAHTIKKYNPGSSAFVLLGRIERPPPVFQRMYICLKACVDGFVNGCRPLVGVDGCHLKGMYPGMILVAVAMDGNNNIYPLAWAVVEVENRDSWQWFLELLVSDIGAEEGAGITFMSDRQKGLLDALKVVVPKADIRFCVRHIWANFKLQFPGQAYKDSFWKAAWATTQVKTCSLPASRRRPFRYIKLGPCSHDVKKETKYSHLQRENVDQHIDYIQALYPSVSKPEPTDKQQSIGQADSNATSLNLSDMLALDDEFSSADSKKTEALVTVAGYRVKPEVGPTLRGILAKYGDIAANCKKSTEFRSLLLQNVCEIVRKLEATEFVCLTTVEIDSFRLLLKDMELDVNVGWLLKRLDELNGAKKLLRESPIVKQIKRRKESEIIVYEIEIQRLQEQIKCAQNAMELKKEEKRKFDKVLFDTKVKLKKYHCGSMTDGLI